MANRGRPHRGPCMWRAAALALLAAATLPWHAPSAHAQDWREALGTFRIGLVARPGQGNTIAGAREVEAVFSRALGMPAKLFVARDYAALIDAQATGRIEYAVYSALAYATASRLCGCVEPLVAPAGMDGAEGVISILIVRKEKADDDLSGLRIAIDQKDSLTGRLLALSGPDRAEGVSGNDPAGLVEAAGAEEAERLFAAGEVDGLFGWEAPVRTGAPGGTMARLAEAGIDASTLAVRWRSPLVPFGPHAVRTDLATEAKTILTRLLVGLDETHADIYEILEENLQGGFVAASATDYEAAGLLVEEIAGKPR